MQLRLLCDRCAGPLQKGPLATCYGSGRFARLWRSVCARIEPWGGHMCTQDGLRVVWGVPGSLHSLGRVPGQGSECEQLKDRLGGLAPPRWVATLTGENETRMNL